MEYFFRIFIISLTLNSGWAIEPRMVYAEATVLRAEPGCHGANCVGTKNAASTDNTSPRESVLTPGSFFLLGVGLIVLRVVGKRFGRAKEQH